MGLNLSKTLGVESIVVQSDLQLVVGQVNRICEAKEERMKKHLSTVKHCITAFTKVEFIQVPSIDILEVQQVDGEANQTTAIVSYLRDELLLEDKEEAWKLRIQATEFILMDKVLLKEFSFNPI